MPRSVTVRLAAGALGSVLAIGIMAAPDADAAVKPRVFDNCTQLNSVYHHGVGKVGAHDKVKGKGTPVTTFTRETALYQANINRDGDHDGVACEKR